MRRKGKRRRRHRKRQLKLNHIHRQYRLKQRAYVDVISHRCRQSFIHNFTLEVAQKIATSFLSRRSTDLENAASCHRLTNVAF